MTKEVIVSGGNLGDAAAAASSLPATAAFARIRLPGGFTIKPANGESQWGYPAHHHYRFDAESTFYAANTRVGAIPIVAKIEVQDPKALTWGPAAAGVSVHFQLIVPDAPPAGTPEHAPDLRQTTIVQTTGPAPHGPAKYVADQIAAVAAVAGDPQVDNCPKTRGGKRDPGNGNANDYFETSSRNGFNTAPAVAPAGGAPAPVPFPVAAASSHTLAVMAQTNAAGEAGVIFRPSRQGGDRFKLRVFVDPIGSRASDGTEATAAKAETGTFVVWRTLRFSRNIVFDYQAGATAADRTAASGAVGTIDFAGMSVDYARCYLEMIRESTLAREVHRIGDAEWVRAINYVRANIGAQPTGTHQRFNISVLFPNANATSGVIRIIDPAPYNTAIAAIPGNAFPNADTANWTDWDSLITQAQEKFLEYFTRNSLSGLTVMQAPMGDSYTHLQAVAGNSQNYYSTSGVSMHRRGCWLFYGTGAYVPSNMPYDLNKNTMHEVGHTLFMPHHWTDRGAGGAVSGGVPNEHDYKDYCIMSYQKNQWNDHDYCGRCNLKLRGWDTRDIPINNR
jgi:hypothetical protein